MPPAFDDRGWRDELIQSILRVGLIIGVPVYAFSVFWAWAQNVHGIIFLDTAVLALVATVWWFNRWPYLVRAILFCFGIYVLGAALLTVAGVVGQIYLLGQSALTAVFLGTRFGLASVMVNTLTLLAMGVSGLFVWEMQPAEWSDRIGSWILVSVNFLLVASLVTLVVGLVLRRLDAALEREVAARNVLRDRERRLRTLIDATPDAVMVLRDDMSLQEANPAAFRMLGIPGDSGTINDPFDAFVAARDVETFRTLHTAVCRGESGQCEIRLRSGVEEEIVVDLVSVPLEIDAGRTRHLAIARDVTSDRQLQEQLRRAQRLEAVGKLTGGIAHDFNNLLTVVLGNSDMLAELLADQPDLQKLAETTRGAAERGASLTERLLSFSRQQTLAPRVIDVGQQLRAIEPLLRRSLGENIDIRIAGDDRGAVAEVDPHQLENAVLNLCINARDAMPNGGRLTLDVAIEHSGEGSVGEGATGVDSGPTGSGHFVVLTVSDTGTGMSEDVASRAFEPFFTTKEVGKGTGLGLSQVYGFVEQSSGRAEIQSSAGEGTSISLYLPAIDAPVHGAALDASSDRQEAVLPRGSETILVVEDNADVRRQVCRQLETLGYAVVVAASGDEALDQLKSNRHLDLLFTDVVMPGELNGRDLADLATRLRPDLPILLTSGYAEQSVFPGGRVPGGMRLLNKPYRRSALADTLREVLSRPNR